MDGPRVGRLRTHRIHEPRDVRRQLHLSHVRLAAVRDKGREPEQLGDRVARLRRGLAQQPPRLPAECVPRLRSTATRPFRSRDPRARARRSGLGCQTRTGGNDGVAVIAETRSPDVEATLEIVIRLFGGFRGGLSVRLWDGTIWEAPGPPAAFTIVLNHRGSLRAMLADPRRLQLSLAEAFVYGDFDLEGDLEAVFPLGDYLLKERDWGRREQLWAVRAVRALPSGRSDANGRTRPRLSGRRDSSDRLAQAVHYHYDQEPEFYGLFLDPQRVYTCA